MRVAVTELDAYRNYKANGTQEAFDQLIHRLLYRSRGTLWMEAGSAFHSALEVQQPCDNVTELRHDGYLFTISPEISVTLDLPPVRECWCRGYYTIDGIEVILTGKVDAAFGKRIDDHKLMGRFNPLAMLETYQWRAYLMLMGCNVFRWNCFIYSADERAECFMIQEIQTFECYRYPGMEADVLAELADFVRFVRAHAPARVDTNYKKVLR
jgi:hypothetical protein